MIRYVFISLYLYFTRKMSKLFVSVFGIFTLLLFSVVSGDNNELRKDITGIFHDASEEYVPHMLERQLLESESGEEQVRLGKDYGKPVGRREMNDDEIIQPPGMWGRSLHNRKQGVLKINQPNEYRKFSLKN